MRFSYKKMLFYSLAVLVSNLAITKQILAEVDLEFVNQTGDIHVGSVYAACKSSDLEGCKKYIKEHVANIKENILPLNLLNVSICFGDGEQNLNLDVIRSDFVHFIEVQEIDPKRNGLNILAEYLSVAYACK